MTLKCRDTKLWPLFCFLVHHNVSTVKSTANKLMMINLKVQAIYHKTIYKIKTACNATSADSSRSCYGYPGLLPLDCSKHLLKIMEEN
jgi:hypothetical protein